MILNGGKEWIWWILAVIVFKSKFVHFINVCYGNRMILNGGKKWIRRILALNIFKSKFVHFLSVPCANRMKKIKRRKKINLVDFTWFVTLSIQMDIWRSSVKMNSIKLLTYSAIIRLHAQIKPQQEDSPVFWWEKSQIRVNERSHK